jgi:hypothetical protein
MKNNFKNKILLVLVFAMIITMVIPITKLPITKADVGQDTVFMAKQDLVNEFKTLCDNHNDKASYTIFGYTYLNTPMYCFLIGNSSASNKIVLDAALHGWEDAGSIIEYNYATWLLTNNSAVSTYILAHNYYIIVPYINLDSNHRWTVWERDNTWNYTSNDWVFTGTPNLNRNFNYSWNNGDSDTMNPYAGNWRGAYPLCTYEAQAIRNLLTTYQPTKLMDVHYGGIGFYWSQCDTSTEINGYNSTYNTVLDALSLSHSTYVLNDASTVQGTLVDYAKYYFNITAFNLEVGDPFTPLMVPQLVNTNITDGSEPKDNWWGFCSNHTGHTLTDVNGFFTTHVMPAFMALANLPTTLDFTPISTNLTALPNADTFLAWDVNTQHSGTILRGTIKLIDNIRASTGNTIYAWNSLRAYPDVSSNYIEMGVIGKFNSSNIMEYYIYSDSHLNSAHNQTFVKIPNSAIGQDIIVYMYQDENNYNVWHYCYDDISVNDTMIELNSYNFGYCLYAQTVNSAIQFNGEAHSTGNWQAFSNTNSVNTWYSSAWHTTDFATQYNDYRQSQVYGWMHDGSILNTCGSFYYS